MIQTHIYDHLGVENDPIFRMILKLQAGQAIEIGGVHISYNLYGLYVVETESSHDCYRSIKQLYDGIAKQLSLIV